MANALEYPDSDFSEDDRSPLDVSFDSAADRVRSLTAELGNDRLLELYGLYKQATEGGCEVPKPSWFDGRGRKKWEAWRARGDLTREEAKRRYVELARESGPAERSEPAGGGSAWVRVSSLRRGGSPEPAEGGEAPPLLAAAREDHAGRVAELLRSQPALAALRDAEGLTALHWAADRGAAEALAAALRGGCAADAADGAGQTALHYAAGCGHASCVRLLLAAGARLLRDAEGCEPLDVAEDAEVRRLLLEAAAAAPAADTPGRDDS